MKCNHCGEEEKLNGVGCDWRQGRCPHRMPMVTEYNLRFYNLIQWLKGLFKKKDCDCGHH
jgi:hypothetical protein